MIRVPRGLWTSPNAFVVWMFLKRSFLPLQEFDDYRDADDAIADLNGKELLGERCVKQANLDKISILNDAQINYS